MEHLLKRGDIVRIARRKNCFSVVWAINPKTQKSFLFPLVFDPDFHHRTDISLVEPIFFRGAYIRCNDAYWENVQQCSNALGKITLETLKLITLILKREKENLLMEAPRNRYVNSHRF